MTNTSVDASNSLVVEVSPEVACAVADAQKLVSYIAREGLLQLDETLTQAVISAKHKVSKNQWTQEDESEFLLAYDRLTAAVHPVTVESIDAVLPNSADKKRAKTRAERAVSWYRGYTLVALAFLVIFQVYWLFGNDLRLNLQSVFESREQTQLALNDDNNNLEERNALLQQLKVENQKLDANYNLLLLWNRVWSFGGTFEHFLPEYFKREYEMKKKRLLDSSVSNGERIDQLELDRSLHEVRIVFFENILSADFILNAFQSYLLPLLYGLLGALIYVLRELLTEIRQLTYGFDSEIRYRLKLTLGALGGMVIGWFFRPDEAAALASLSPMALAFLMGYNVDMLFSLMDKMINNVSKTLGQEKGAAPVQAATKTS